MAFGPDAQDPEAATIAPLRWVPEMSPPAEAGGGLPMPAALPNGNSCPAPSTIQWPPPLGAATAEVNAEPCGRGWPKSSELYRDFASWKDDRGEHAMSATRWGEQMQRRFRRIEAHGMRYVGVLLRDLRT